MTVETATYISQLNTANPSGSDAKSEGDDHLRLLKSTLRATFPNFGAAALAASNTQLDKLVTTFSIASAPSTAVTIDASGNVGVAQSTPAAKLDVNGAARFQSILDLVGGAGAALFRLFNNTRNFSIRSESGSLVFKDESAAVDRGYFDANGNFVHAVNTAAPTISANQMAVVSLPSDTQLRFSVRGSDGVTRTANLTLS